MIIFSSSSCSSVYAEVAQVLLNPGLESQSSTQDKESLQNQSTQDKESLDSEHSRPSVFRLTALKTQRVFRLRALKIQRVSSLYQNRDQVRLQHSHSRTAVRNSRRESALSVQNSWELRAQTYIEFVARINCIILTYCPGEDIAIFNILMNINKASKLGLLSISIREG